MKTFSDFIEETNVENINEEIIDEGFFDWIKNKLSPKAKKRLADFTKKMCPEEFQNCEKAVEKNDEENAIKVFNDSIKSIQDSSSIKDKTKALASLIFTQQAIAKEKKWDKYGETITNKIKELSKDNKELDKTISELSKETENLEKKNNDDGDKTSDPNAEKTAKQVNKNAVPEPLAETVTNGLNYFIYNEDGKKTLAKIDSTTAKFLTKIYASKGDKPELTTEGDKTARLVNIICNWKGIATTKGENPDSIAEFLKLIAKNEDLWKRLYGAN